MDRSVTKIDKSWREILNDQFNAEYFQQLTLFLEKEKKSEKIYPPESEIFAAFNLTPFEEVKVVILGQDPYHGKNQAHGLCFSVREGLKLPPSLKNIFKELHSDLGLTPPPSGNLEKWARQGVLLLNATLTVRAGEAGSHQTKGWEQFTDAVIRELSLKRGGVIFLLWGGQAGRKAALIDAAKHHILKSSHPSPLSSYRGFFGCRHFSKTNAILREQGSQEIDWSL